MAIPNLKRIALFVQKLLGGPEFSTLGHVTQATPILASFCFPWRGASSVCVPNSKRIGQFVQKLFRGPEIMKLGHVTPATPTYGSFCGPYAGRFCPVCLYRI